ncbi:hypothetical protein BHM03_00045588, partial [Ensete ventricosum]
YGIGKKCFEFNSSSSQICLIAREEKHQCKRRKSARIQRVGNLGGVGQRRCFAPQLSSKPGPVFFDLLSSSERRRRGKGRKRQLSSSSTVKKGMRSVCQQFTP